MRLMAEGTLAGIMAVNGAHVLSVSVGAGWAETVRRAPTVSGKERPGPVGNCQLGFLGVRMNNITKRRVCRACRQVPAGQ